MIFVFRAHYVYFHRRFILIQLHSFTWLCHQSTQNKSHPAKIPSANNRQFFIHSDQSKRNPKKNPCVEKTKSKERKQQQQQKNSNKINNKRANKLSIVCMADSFWNKHYSHEWDVLLLHLPIRLLWQWLAHFTPSPPPLAVFYQICTHARTAHQTAQLSIDHKSSPRIKYQKYMR